MARAPRPLLHLPSGLVARVVAPPGPPRPAGSLAALVAFQEGHFSLATPSGDSLRVDDLTVPDFQVVRAFLTARGHLDEPAVTRPCSNCQAPLTVRPCAGLELGPYLDGDASDEAPAVFGEPLPIDPIELRSPGSSGEHAAHTVELRRVRVGEARPLFEAAAAAQASGGPVRLTGAVVSAAGIVRLGDEDHPARIARALQRADEAAFSDVAGWIDLAMYPERLRAWVRCEACGARHEIEAPAVKEFPPDDEPAAEVDAPFESFASFAKRVERHASRVFRRRAAQGVGLFVEEGPADCDEGGVALLGAYEPAVPEGHGVLAHGPEVKIYYRTFLAMHREDGPYDVDAEIVETLEHELDHHEANLRGEDPVDDDERAQITDELRAHLGDTESLRRASRAARGSVADFLYRTWPLWVLVLLLALWEGWVSRR